MTGGIIYRPPLSHDCQLPNPFSEKERTVAVCDDCGTLHYVKNVGGHIWQPFLFQGLARRRYKVELAAWERGER